MSGSILDFRFWILDFGLGVGACSKRLSTNNFILNLYKRFNAKQLHNQSPITNHQSLITNHYSVFG